MKVAWLLCAALLAGCGTWSKPGGTQAQLDMDRQDCDLQAGRDHPPQIMFTPELQSPANPACSRIYGQESCMATGPQPPDTRTDLNAGARSVAFERCLTSRGYRYTP